MSRSCAGAQETMSEEEPRAQGLGGGGGMFSAFIDEWSPDVLGTTWALRTVDGQWSACMVTPRAPEEEQTARCTGWGGAFIHYFSPLANIYVDPTSRV